MINKTVITDFVRHERLRGLKSLRKIPYLLKPFLHYLESQGLEIEQLKHREAQEYQTMLATIEDKEGKPHYAASSVSDMVNCASNFYIWLKKNNKVFTNPFSGIRRIKRKNRLPKGVSKEKKMDEFLTKLRNFQNEKDLRTKRSIYRVHVLAELQYATGMRISELAGLKKEDIDFESHTVVVKKAKGGTVRTAYLNDYAANVLKVYVTTMREIVLKRPRSEQLFGCKEGRNLGAGVNRRLKEKAKECGIPHFTSHSFRHSLGFHLLRRGCDMRYIQIILGHEDMNSTSIYTKVEKTDLKEELDRCHPRGKQKR